MSTFVKPNQVPETRGTKVGSAKRNIMRKGHAPTSRKANASGACVDDGSTSYVGALDEHDPNFDSEEDEGVEWSEANNVAQESMTLTHYKRAVEPLIAEYFSSGDVYDFLDNITNLRAPAYLYELVKRSINMSFDRNDRERELISQFLSIAYPDLLSSSTLGKGFERLFEQIDELVKDSPKARNMLTIFLARAVVDEILPPSYLMDPVVCNLGGEVVVHARTMLSQEHTGTKFDHIWGPGDGQRTVKELKLSIDQLCEEYLLSNQLEEATRCVKEMNISQYHHEVVKRAVKVAMDKEECDQLKMSALLTYLIKTSEVVSTQQCEKGFNRIREALCDWVLDTPLASNYVHGFVTRAVADGLLPSSFLDTAPAATTSSAV